FLTQGLDLGLRGGVVVLPGGEIALERLQMIRQLLDLVAEPALGIGELAEQRAVVGGQAGRGSGLGRDGPRVPGPRGRCVVVLLCTRQTGSDETADEEQDPQAHRSGCLMGAARAGQVRAGVARACAGTEWFRARDGARRATSRSARSPC